MKLVLSNVLWFVFLGIVAVVVLLLAAIVHLSDEHRLALQLAGRKTTW